MMNLDRDRLERMASPPTHRAFGAEGAGSRAPEARVGDGDAGGMMEV